MTPMTLTGEAEAIRLRYEQFLFQCSPPLYDEPLALTEGKGTRVRDAGGEEYLDFFGGILTTSLGHCHPEVNAAVAAQMERLGHVSTLYLNEPQTEMAERLAQIAPPGLHKTFFTNSGSEAIETAVLLAQQATGQSEIVALRHGYSGRSTLTSNLTGHGPWRPTPSSIAGIKHVRSPYPYRCPFHAGRDQQDCDDRCVEALADDLIETIETTTNRRPAAMLIETIQGVGGYIVPPPGYFQRMAEIIRSYGGLLIIDEVQTGFGRTGGKWFGIEHWGIEPDIMVMAKGIANGFPVAATMARAEVAAAWKAKTISTFGGNPICMAAAVAVNKVMVRENVPQRAEVLGTRLRAGLVELAAAHPWIGEVRGMGLMQALEIVTDRKTKTPDAARAKRFLEATKSERLLVGLGGLRGNVVRMGPSLLIDESEVVEALARLERAAARVAE